MHIPLISPYMHWLHTRWPAGTVEKLPVVNDDGSTNVSGLYVVGDLTGVPLLKFSADTGAKVVRKIAAAGASPSGDVLDVLIIGAGVSGVSAAIEARKAGLRYKLLEASERFSTIVNFPKQKPIFTYPAGMRPAGELQFRDEVHPKETLLEDLDTQAAGIETEPARATHVSRSGGVLHVHLADNKGTIDARNVVVAIGRSGNFRKLGVEGENLGKVYNRLHDPKEFAGKNVVVVGGGDSALEAAIALAQCGAHVTLSYRKPEFARPKPDNIDKLAMLSRGDMPEIENPTSERQTTSVGDYMGERTMGSIRLELASTLKRITDESVALVDKNEQEHTLPNDAVFAMIGREAPLDFFRRSGVRIHGERTTTWWVTLIAFLAFCVWMYHWKKGGVVITGTALDPYLDIGGWWARLKLFPYGFAEWLGSLGGAWANPANLLGTLKISLNEPGFYYTVAYCLCVVGFGIDRVRRKPTPYIKKQTTVLALVQVIPLFFLPYLLLPWMGHNGWFDGGFGKWFADTFFPIAGYGHGREYWRAFGFILAWPLFIWNVFTEQPMWGWLVVSVVQTFVIIPGLIYFFGKGVYCGWICSCGALAETLGDRHRTKMPHGPFWNRFNMVGQVFLAFAMILLVLRVLAWSGVGWAGTAFKFGLKDLPLFNYVWFVDLLWAGILGVGVYFWFSGRFWCRFACPLAALMHIYHRFSRFAIVADKKKCISCNVCTSVCHQGIDVMNFANKGLAMRDPECVRCSACVVNCPTGVLTFGMVDRAGQTTRKDKTLASFVHMSELTINGKKHAG
jgi:NosR/NirI family transcriptional regulator, nitrous oxide reductase regulator